MKHETDHTYTLVLTVHNNPGVLVRCAQVFNRRGHNIEALQVTPVPGSQRQSHMSITAFGDAKATAQITMQLQKLVDVEHVAEEN
jgi:acetolactate synthase I/III small subunit